MEFNVGGGRRGGGGKGRGRGRKTKEAGGGGSRRDQARDEDTEKKHSSAHHMHIPCTHSNANPNACSTKHERQPLRTQPTNATTPTKTCTNPTANQNMFRVQLKCWDGGGSPNKE